MLAGPYINHANLSLPACPDEGLCGSVAVCACEKREMQRLEERLLEVMMFNLVRLLVTNPTSELTQFFQHSANRLCSQHFPNTSLLNDKKQANMEHTEDGQTHSRATPT